MFLIDKYKIINPWDVIINENIYLKLLNLDSLNSWNTKSLDSKIYFKNLPNLFIFGMSGCGKTSLINLLLKRIYGNIKVMNVKYNIQGYGCNNIEVDIPQSIYHIEINPTSTGLDKYYVQEIIKEYAERKLITFDNVINFKIIWIKNIEKLSYYAQTSLRCIMEKYSNSCKFILSGKCISKVLEPIKSRCLLLNIPIPKKLDIFKILMKISYNEKKFLKLEDYFEIINSCEYDIKNAIFFLEMKYYNIPIKIIWKENILEIIKILKNIINYNTITENNIEKIRSILYKLFITNINSSLIIIKITENLLEIVKDKKLYLDIINTCVYHENNIANGKRSIIHLESYIFNLLDILVVANK